MEWAQNWLREVYISKCHGLAVVTLRPVKDGSKKRKESIISITVINSSKKRSKKFTQLFKSWMKQESFHTRSEHGAAVVISFAIFFTNLWPPILLPLYYEVSEYPCYGWLLKFYRETSAIRKQMWAFDATNVAGFIYPCRTKQCHERGNLNTMTFFLFSTQMGPCNLQISKQFIEKRRTEMILRWKSF